MAEFPTPTESGDERGVWRQESNYGSDSVHHWSDVAEFHAAVYRPDGMHVIASAHGGPYELFTRNDPFEHSRGPVLVIFSGAVTSREDRTPPFVSGRSLAPNLGLPLIALSDPSLSLATDLSIAWYAGSQTQQVQMATEELLRPLADVLDGDLWLVGGSAGGFAALETGHRLGPRCSVFVWNPQTILTEYFPRFVRNYAERSFPAAAADLRTPRWKEELTRTMEATGCRSDLTEEKPGDGAPRRLVCLQSADDDWHVRSHAFPYLSSRGYQRLEPGIWSEGPQRVFWFTETGIGHAPPSGENIHAILDRLMGPSMRTSIEQVLEMDGTDLFDRSQPWTRPEDLRSVRTEVASLVSWRLRGHKVSGTLRMLPNEYGRLRWQADLLDPRDRVLMSEKDLPMTSTWKFDPSPEAHRVRVMLLDGMGHLLVRRHLNLTSAKGAR